MPRAIVAILVQLIPKSHSGHAVVYLLLIIIIIIIIIITRKLKLQVKLFLNLLMSARRRVLKLAHPGWSRLWTSVTIADKALVSEICCSDDTVKLHCNLTCRMVIL